jgi:23S rRNA (adenine2030-N6)-methyltransferase
MNYDHRFHAGNFADVFKHVVLTRILLYLARKTAPFRVIDTHAGRGLYDLAEDAAARTQEWQGGIGRIDREAMSSEARGLIDPYLGIVGAAASGRAPYPGSPAIALRMTRPFDRMIFCELHPSAFASLRRCVGRDTRAKAIALDGYVGLNAFIPPVERRGLILLDPPFEAEDEFDRLGDAILAAQEKWRSGVIMAWHPIKERRGIERLAARIAKAELPDVLRLELAVDGARDDGRLVANGLIIVNPPFTLEEEMACLLPELQRQLGTGSGAWWMNRHVGG